MHTNRVAISFTRSDPGRELAAHGTEYLKRLPAMCLAVLGVKTASGGSRSSTILRRTRQARSARRSRARHRLNRDPSGIALPVRHDRLLSSTTLIASPLSPRIRADVAMRRGAGSPLIMLRSRPISPPPENGIHGRALCCHSIRAVIRAFSWRIGPTSYSTIWASRVMRTASLV